MPKFVQHNAHKHGHHVKPKPEHLPSGQTSAEAYKQNRGKQQPKRPMQQHGYPKKSGYLN
jgi:hypothetical protein